MENTEKKFHMVSFDGDFLFHDDGNNTEKLFYNVLYVYTLSL